jgi:hypothetical protein
MARGCILEEGKAYIACLHLAACDGDPPGITFPRALETSVDILRALKIG